MASAHDIKEEQAYFDNGWEARERTRQTLENAHQAAAGPRAAASAVNKDAKARLKKLGDVDEPVAFARFDDDANESLYLGKHVITDDAGDILVINWQAPAASPYFQASYDDPCGVKLRRKFSTERNRVLNFEEVIFANLAAAVEDLTAAQRSGIDDTVLRDLEQDRTGEMQDIVQTIQSAQYQLIRSDIDQLLVIQGGPGTGKTAVALHRVSWLLFTHHRTLRPEDVLVVGPNPTFTRYIRSVLPGLGDSDVQHHHLRSLGPQASSRRQESRETARLKGEARMGDLIAAALRQRVRFPSGLETLDVGPSGRATTLSRASVEAELRRLVRSSGTYNNGRAAFRSWLTSQSGSAANPTQIDAATERAWPSLTPQQFLRDLFGSRERLVAAAGDDFTAGDANRLLRAAAQRIADEEWSDEDVALLDEADYLINGNVVRYSHIVVDEAQDLTPMQLRSLRRRSKGGSMTLVGDLAQSTGPWARDSWDDVVSALRRDSPPKIEELLLGYRVPEQVFALAAQLLPEAAPLVTPPRVIRVGPAEPDLRQVDVDDRVAQAVSAAREFAGRGLFVGIICPNSLREDLVDQLEQAQVVWSDASKGNLSTSLNVIGPDEAKGLEFDAVVVLEPEAIVASSARGLRLLYVALTRTTRYLTVVHSGALLPLSPTAQTATPSVQPLPLVSSHTPPPPALLDVTPSTLRTNEGTGPENGSTSDDTPATEAQAAIAPPTTRESTPKVAPKEAAETERRPASGTSREGKLARLVSQSVAAALAEDVRESVPQHLWPYVIDLLRRELEVSESSVFDLFD